MKLKLKEILLLIWVLVIITAFVIYSVKMYKKFNPNIKVGQIWVKEYNIDNPYEEVERDTIVILDVNGDYALYTKNGHTYSIKLFSIPVNGRLIKDVDE